MSQWDDLSMREKAAMMRVAVRNKIFDIDKIKEAYNAPVAQQYMPRQTENMKTRTVLDNDYKYNTVSPTYGYGNQRQLNKFDDGDTGVSSFDYTVTDYLPDLNVGIFKNKPVIYDARIGQHFNPFEQFNTHLTFKPDRTYFPLSSESITLNNLLNQVDIK